MKLIIAVIRPDRVNDVLKQLFMAEVHGLTISDAKGHGGERAQVETYRGTSVRMELTDKVRIEIAVSDEFVDRTVEAIISAAHTGAVGDGKVFVMSLDASYRIRTGERDEAAVTPIR
jgi:nitrogen regulatory protein P-II 1